MDSRLFGRVGTNVFGPKWKRPLAAAIKLSDRQIARWAQEGHPIPRTLRDGRSMPKMMLSLLERHQGETVKLIERVRRLVAAPGAGQ